MVSATCVRLFEPRAWRQFHLQHGEPDVTGRREALRNERDQCERRDQQSRGNRERLAPVSETPFDRDQILALDPAVLVRLRVRLQHVRGHHRREHAGDQQREHHGHGGGEGERSEELTRHTAHERDRHEDGAQRQRRRDDGKADLDRGVGRSLERLLAVAQMAHDVLDFDDRIVDQHADDQRQREQREQVQRVAQQIHRPERRNDRQRQRGCGDDRGAPVAQEDPHDDHCEQRALEQHLHRSRV